MIEIVNTSYTCPNVFGGSAKAGEIITITLTIRAGLLQQDTLFNCYQSSDSIPTTTNWLVFPGSFKPRLLNAGTLAFELIMPDTSVSIRIGIRDNANPANSAVSKVIAILSDWSSTKIDEIARTQYKLSVNTSQGGSVLVWLNGQLQKGSALFLKPLEYTLQAGTQVELTNKVETAFSFDRYFINNESVLSGRTSFIMTENKKVMTSFVFKPVEGVHIETNPYDPLPIKPDKDKEDEGYGEIIIVAGVGLLAIAVIYLYRRKT